MKNVSSVRIRKFNTRDRPVVREIAYETAFLGEPATLFSEAKEIIADALTSYFTDYEPESCFVAESNGKVVAFLNGAKSRAISEKTIFLKIIPRLFCNVLFHGILFRKKNIAFLFSLLTSALKGEFKMPDFTEKYPSMLHINVKKGYRGLTIGTQLINAYFEYLGKEGVRGVCLATMSSAAGEFFTKQGFHLLYSGARSYLRPIIKKDVPVYIYGKVLQ